MGMFESKGAFDYFIEKDKFDRIVIVAKMNGCRYEISRSLQKTFDKVSGNGDSSFIFDPFYRTCELVPDTIIGKATCSISDEFDVEKGKAIARARVLEKYYYFKTKVFDDYSEKMSKIADAFAGASNFSANKFYIYCNKNNAGE